MKSKNSGLFGLPSPLSSLTRACAPAKIAGLALIASATLASQASAVVILNVGSPNSVEFQFDTDAGLSDKTTIPSGPAPWAVATFVDTPTPNLITATFTVPNNTLVDGEKLTKFYFNYDPGVFTGSFAVPSISGDAQLAPNGFKYDVNGGPGGFTFDLLFGLANNNALTKGESVTLSLVYTPVGSEIFDVAELLVGNAPFALAHIQAIDNGDGSLWVTPGSSPNFVVVPEPGSTAALMGLLSCGLFLRSRRCRKA